MKLKERNTYKISICIINILFEFCGGVLSLTLFMVILYYTLTLPVHIINHVFEQEFGEFSIFYQVAYRLNSIFIYVIDSLFQFKDIFLDNKIFIFICFIGIIEHIKLFIHKIK